MPKEVQAVGDAIGGFFGNPAVQLGIRAIAIYFVVLWLAGAYWAFRDMQLRTENPFLPYAAASLIIVFTPVFFPFAIIVYRIVRPQERIGEVYERALAEEALLAEVEAIHTCPACTRRVHEDWIICPTCRTRLKRVCPNCEKLVGLDWSLCAWCGRDFERSEVVTALDPRSQRAAWQASVQADEQAEARGVAGAVATGAVASGGAMLALETVSPVGGGGATPTVIAPTVASNADANPGGASARPPLRDRRTLRDAAQGPGAPGGIVNPRSGARRSAPGPLSEP